MPEPKRTQTPWVIDHDASNDNRELTTTTGLVSLRTLSTWTKEPQLIETLLTPAEARRLAEHLLNGARRAEGDYST